MRSIYLAVISCVCVRAPLLQALPVPPVPMPGVTTLARKFNA